MTINEYLDKGYSIQDLLNKIGKIEEENKKLKCRITELETENYVLLNEIHQLKEELKKYLILFANEKGLIELKEY